MEELLDLAFDDPDAASAKAAQIVERSDDPVALSFALQCLGIVERERSRVELSIAHFRSALQWARKSDRDDRVRDVRASLGGTLIMAGETRAGLRHLDAAVDTDETDEVAARVLMRRAFMLGFLGRVADAHEVLVRALQFVQASGDTRWEARTFNNLAHLEIRQGDLERAERHLDRSEQLFLQIAATAEARDVWLNRGAVAAARGDLAAALRWFTAAARDAEAHEQPADYSLALAAGYRAAGLAREAAARLQDLVDGTTLPAAIDANVRVELADALLACGEAVGALGQAERAHAEFVRQDRDPTRALLALLRAREAQGKAPGHASEAIRVADVMDAERSDDAPVALILAARLAEGGDRSALLRRAAGYRTSSTALVRASAWLACGFERDGGANTASVLRACDAGLAAIDEHRRTLGSSELRAAATSHGRDLMVLALRHAASDARTLLRWSERTRATALALPPVTASDEEVPASLAALRDNGRRLAAARATGEPIEQLEKERTRLERAVRAEHHQTSAGGEAAERVPVEQLVAGVGDGCLVELVDVDGTIHVLVVHDGRVRRRIAGTTAEVLEISAMSKMLLRRASRGRPADWTDVARRLETAVLGDAVRLIPQGPVVIAPPARLHDLAWALLPALHDRPFSVVPSGAQWMRAKAITRPRRRRTVLVAGPDLASGGAEVPVLAERHPDALHLAGADASLEATLEALDGADLVHLAAHGKFRGDSPLFSAIELADGPLVVHDLERLKRAPYRLVLSACESGVLAPVGADEVLGLAACLFSIGSAGLVCSVGEVNDAATATLMVDLHDSLARGADPASALHEVRQRASADPIAAGTAAAFLALGV